MLKRAVRDQIVSMLGTLQEGVEYAQQAKVFMAKKIFFDSVASIESIMAAAEEGISPEKNAEYQEIFGRLLPLFRTSKINEGDFIRQNLAQLTSMFEAEREICREVLFLPYKASMWDSLESIWQAANADDDCECYVMPIPYCDRNPDGSVAKWHYEGDIFPADVPITSFETYDIAKRRPDIIYFHNPYDDYNRVTSVHPAYYSRELKKHTQKLVYVPYFVTDGKGISDHFCQVPGVENADIVVAQSEEVKAVYAKFIPAEKVLALGSPKFDKVLWNQQHKPPMPEEWEKIAQGRKLILYNTHLTPLMIDDGSVCRKLRYVFSCFEGRDDVCLLWRPHPLSEATMQAMNPSALAEYHRMVAEYKKSGLGIYDESPDVHRAIALSAAYYGDMSSLVPMYEVTGKPIMLQDIKACFEEDEEDMRALSFNSYLIDGDTMWFTAIFLNGLFSVELSKNIVKFWGAFPEGEPYQQNMYSKIIKFRNKLFFIPISTNCIMAFDIDRASFTKYKLFDDKNIVHARCIEAVLYDGWIYLFSLENKSIIKFNPLTGELRYHEQWYKKIEPFLKNDNSQMFACAQQADEMIWLVCQGTNLIIKFCLPDLGMQIFRIGDAQNIYLSMDMEGNDFWLTSKKGDKVVCWNSITGETREYKDFPLNFKKQMLGMINCKCSNENVWILPGVGETILRLDSRSGKMAEYTQYPLGFKYLRKPYPLKFSAVHKESDYMITAMPIEANMLLRIDTKTGRVMGQKILFPKAEYDKWYEAIVRNVDDYLQYESRGVIYLQTYMSFVGLERKNDKNMTINACCHSNKDFGKCVHLHVKEIFKNVM